MASTGELVSGGGQPVITPGSADGEYIVRLFGTAGELTLVTVDDLLPVHAKDSEPLYAQARGGLALCFSLVEKAMAKVHGSYSLLDGGNTCEALWNLTGCPVEEVKLEGLSAAACRPALTTCMKGLLVTACPHLPRTTCFRTMLSTYYLLLAHTYHLLLTAASW